MIEAGVAFMLFDKILAGLGLIRDGKKQRTEKIDHALRALYVALMETRAYITERENGKHRNRKREYQLADLWHSASIPLRTIDKDFARRCFAKGNYWMDPEAWNKGMIEETGIAIDRVLEKTRSLLLQ